MKTLKTALSYIPYLLLFYSAWVSVREISSHVAHGVIYPIMEKSVLISTEKSAESLIWTLMLYVVTTLIFWVYFKTIITLPTIILNAHDRFYSYCFGKSISLPSIKPIHAFMLQLLMGFYIEFKPCFYDFDSQKLIDKIIYMNTLYPLFAIQLWGLKKNANFVVKKLRLY